MQALDTRLDQLAHRRRTLPEVAAVQELARRARSLEDEQVSARTAVLDLEREVAKAEADVDLVRQRAARDRARLESGQGSAKDLAATQHELVSLSRRQSELEDVQLEVMERLEQAQVRFAEVSEHARKIAEELAATTARRDSAFAELDAEAERSGALRVASVHGLDPGLVTLYEKVRSQRGTGAAAMRGGRCEGCHLELGAVDLGRIRSAAPEDVLRCEECGRILVRTPAAGG